MDAAKTAMGNLKKMLSGKIAKKFAPKKVEVEVEAGGPEVDDEEAEMEEGSPEPMMAGGEESGGEAAEKLEAMGGDAAKLSPDELSTLEGILKKAGC